MKHFVVLISALCFCVTASAGFQGNWAGTGTMTDQTGKVVKCEELTLSLLQDSESLTVNSGDFKCGSMLRSWPTVRFRIGLGGLFYKDSRIGRIAPHTLVATMVHPTSGHNILIQAAENGSTLNYRETWSEPGKTPYQIINGVLQQR